MSVDQGSVSRSVASLSLGLVRDIKEREAARDRMAFHELELQYQVPFSGEAGAAAVWDSVTLKFDHTFIYAPSQRDSPYDRPHFSWGAVCDGGGPVILYACVSGWAVDPTNEAVTGATVSVCAFVPQAEDFVGFGGTLDLTFVGYAGINEDESEI